MAASTPTSYNLVSEARALGLSPSALMRKAYSAWHKDRSSVVLHDIQRAYKTQYQAYLRQQRAKLAGKRSRKPSVAEQILQAAREGKLEEGNRPVSVVRARQIVEEMKLNDREVKGVMALNAGLAKVAKDEWAKHPNNPKRASAQKQERRDIAPADPERFAVEAPVDEPQLTLSPAEMLTLCMEAVAALRKLPREMRLSVVAAANYK